MQKIRIKKAYKILAFGLAFLVFCLSFAVCFPSVPARAEGSRDFRSAMTNDKLSAYAQKVLDCDAELKKHNALSGNYIGWQSLVDAVEDYLSNVSGYTSDQLELLRSQINSFLVWAYGVVADSPEMISVVMERFGYFPATLDGWFDLLAENPLSIFSLISDLASFGLLEDGGAFNPDKLYLFSDEFVNAVLGLCAEELEDEKDSLFWRVDTITFEELYEALGNVSGGQLLGNDGTAGAGNSAIQARAQDAYDYFGHADYPYFFWLELYGDYPQTLLCWQSDVDLYYKDDGVNSVRISTVSSPSDPHYAKLIQYSRNYGSIFSGTGSGVSVQSFDYRPLSKISYFVTVDGRELLIPKSLDVYSRLHDWSNGSPYSVVTTSNFNNYDSSQDNSFVVKGSYVVSSDVTNDYSRIVSEIQTSNDYSDNSVTTVINNYYGTNAPSVPDSPSESEGSGILDFLGETLYALLKEFLPYVIQAVIAWVTGGGSDLAELIALVLELLPDDVGEVVAPVLPTFLPYLISVYCPGEDPLATPAPSGGGAVVYSPNAFLQELDSVGEIVPTFAQRLGNFTAFPAQFGAVVASSLQWIPQDYRDMLVIGLSATLVVALIKFLRG